MNVKFNPVDLSICFVNHNAKELTINCIRSIYEKTKSTSFEIILVDNGSTDGSCKLINDIFPQVKIITNKQNKGFAYANNQAIKASKGKYIILLNNDTILKNDALDKMVSFMEANQKVGVLTCKLFDADGKTIQRNCRSFPTPWGTMFGRASLLTKLFPNNSWSSKNLLQDWDYNTGREVDWVSGAAFMVRKGVVDEVGMLDDKTYYMYWEDTDWCKRIHDVGYRICFIPDAEITHFTGKGGGKRSLSLSNLMIYQMHKSAYKYFRKHYLKSWLNPMTLITFLGFIVLTSLKITLNSIKMLCK